MLANILLIISTLLILYIYLNLLLLKLKNKNNIVKEYTGFDLSKEITSNYDEINIIESKETLLSKYNLKRKIIKLTTKDYNNNDYYTLSIASLLSGYSLININKDKYLRTISHIFKNIDYLPKSIIISLIISILSNNIGDSKVSLIILSIITIYQYLIININELANTNTNNSLKKLLKKEEYNYITKIKNSITKNHTLSFIISLILILRLVLIILKF